MKKFREKIWKTKIKVDLDTSLDMELNTFKQYVENLFSAKLAEDKIYITIDQHWDNVEFNAILKGLETDEEYAKEKTSWENRMIGIQKANEKKKKELEKKLKKLNADPDFKKYQELKKKFE